MSSFKAEIEQHDSPRNSLLRQNPRDKLQTPIPKQYILMCWPICSKTTKGTSVTLGERWGPRTPFSWHIMGWEWLIEFIAHSFLLALHTDYRPRTHCLATVHTPMVS